VSVGVGGDKISDIEYQISNIQNLLNPDYSIRKNSNDGH